MEAPPGTAGEHRPACGTGDILFEALRYHPKRAVGVDVTHRMLVLANAQRPTAVAQPTPKDSQLGVGNWELGVDPALVVGDMLALPLRSGDFDVVTTGYGLRNVPQLHEAVREIYRVLTRGGRLLSLDFNRPSNAVIRGVYLAYLTVVGSALGLALHRDPDTYRYIPESIRNYPGALGIARLLEAEGFGEVRIVPVLFGLMTIHIARKT
jgi:ubiquinone/menaquinone biosynthesis C-methylase UbiE